MGIVPVGRTESGPTRDESLMSDVSIDPIDVNVSMFMQECETCKGVHQALLELLRELRCAGERCELAGRAVSTHGGAVDGRILLQSLVVKCSECHGTGEILTVLGERLVSAFRLRLGLEKPPGGIPF